MGRIDSQARFGSDILLTRRSLLTLAASASALPALAQEVVFRSDVRLVPLLVSVRNPSDELVGGLAQDDFEVFDDGVQQTISVFERRSAQPLSISLLVDTSSSTGIKRKEEVASIERFLSALLGPEGAGDQVSLYSFDHEVSLMVHFTSRLKRVQEALKRLRGEGGTSLYDAIYLSAGELARREGRKVTVAVTDGGDTTSRVELKEALVRMHYADSIFYGILIRPILNPPGRNVGGENALELLAEGTGGKVYSAAIGEQLDQVFHSILEELRSQYFIAYAPTCGKSDPGHFHRIQVRVKPPGLRVSTRSGYYESS